MEFLAISMLLFIKKPELCTICKSRKNMIILLNFKGSGMGLAICSKQDS